MAEISTPTLLIGLAINGMFTGLGVAIGSYLANKHIISKLEKAEEKTKKVREYIKGLINPLKI